MCCCSLIIARRHWGFIFGLLGRYATIFQERCSRTGLERSATLDVCLDRKLLKIKNTVSVILVIGDPNAIKRALAGQKNPAISMAYVIEPLDNASVILLGEEIKIAPNVQLHGLVTTALLLFPK